MSSAVGDISISSLLRNVRRDNENKNVPGICNLLSEKRSGKLCRGSVGVCMLWRCVCCGGVCVVEECVLWRCVCSGGCV